MDPNLLTVGLFAAVLAVLARSEFLVIVAVVCVASAWFV